MLSEGPTMFSEGSTGYHVLRGPYRHSAIMLSEGSATLSEGPAMVSEAHCPEGQLSCSRLSKGSIVLLDHQRVPNGTKLRSGEEGSEEIHQAGGNFEISEENLKRICKKNQRKLHKNLKKTFIR